MFELPEQKPEGLDKPFVPKLIRLMGMANAWLYRATGGAIGGTWRLGAGFAKPAPVCLLTTIGRKTGEPRTAPLLFLHDGPRIVVVASQGGVPKDPLWYGNLTKTPDVTIQVKRDVRKYRARTANDTERAALWPRLVDVYADYDKCARWTTRKIPVVICEPID